MRKRIVKKKGNSWYVKLEQADQKDWELKDGSVVGVKKLGDKSDD